MNQIDTKATDKLHWMIFDTNVREMWDLNQLIGEEGWDDRDFLIQLEGYEPLIVKGSQVKKVPYEIEPRNAKGQLFILL